MDVFAGLPCNDVDIWSLYTEGDFATAVSKAERVAYGEDGAITGGSFVLTSAFPFATQGVQVGHVCVLESYAVGSQTKAIGDVLAVTAVTAGSPTSTLTLGRVGYPAGQGAYPARGMTLTNIKVFVPSLVAQIAGQWQEVERLIGVNTPADLVNPTDAKTITILKVLRWLYFAQARAVQGDSYWAKCQDLDKQILLELASLYRLYSQDTTQSLRPEAAFIPDLPGERKPRNFGSDDWCDDRIHRVGYPRRGVW